MATSKQRIQAYIDQQLFESFEAERAAWDISQSQALERILAERYNTKAIEAPISDSEPKIDRFKTLEGELKRRVAINGMVFEEIFQRLNDLEGAVSKLASESLATNNSELNSESLTETKGGLDSELPSESLATNNSELNSESLTETKGGLDSELPSESLTTNNSELDGELPSESPIKNLPLIINSTHPYFERLILCLERDEYLSYWTDSDSFSPDIREAKLYEKQTYLLKQIEKLVKRDYDRHWLKFTTARNCIKKDCDRYSLQEIFKRWEKLEERKAKRKSARRKAAIATQ